MDRHKIIYELSIENKRLREVLEWSYGYISSSEQNPPFKNRALKRIDEVLKLPDVHKQENKS